MNTILEHHVVQPDLYLARLNAVTKALSRCGITRKMHLSVVFGEGYFSVVFGKVQIRHSNSEYQLIRGTSTVFEFG